MNYDDWHIFYTQIISDFGYSEAGDAESAEWLSRALKSKDPADTNYLRNIIRGKYVIIIGPAFQPQDLKNLETAAVIIAAGDSAAGLLKYNIIPDIMVTDLDGDVKAQIAASEKGALAVIHAHGDNLIQLKRWLPEFRGKIIGTCQSRPPSGGVIENFGGFTDGDRAVFLARHFGAESIRLLGFDFDNPVAKPGADPVIKMKKLAWAKKLILSLDVEI